MNQVGQKVAIASLFLYFKDPGHDSRVWWLSSSPGGLPRTFAVVLAVRQVMILGSDVSCSVCKS